MRVHVYVHVYVHVHVHVHVPVHVHVSVYVHVHVHVHVSVYVYAYVCVFVFVFVYVHVRVHATHVTCRRLRATRQGVPTTSTLSAIAAASRCTVSRGRSVCRRWATVSTALRGAERRRCCAHSSTSLSLRATPPSPPLHRGARDAATVMMPRRSP